MLTQKNQWKLWTTEDSGKLHFHRKKRHLHLKLRFSLLLAKSQHLEDFQWDPSHHLLKILPLFHQIPLPYQPLVKIKREALVDFRWDNLLQWQKKALHSAKNKALEDSRWVNLLKCRKKTPHSAKNKALEDFQWAKTKISTEMTRQLSIQLRNSSLRWLQLRNLCRRQMKRKTREFSRTSMQLQPRCQTKPIWTKSADLSSTKLSSQKKSLRISKLLSLKRSSLILIHWLNSSKHPSWRKTLIQSSILFWPSPWLRNGSIGAKS